jgi:hypothetical protein
MLKDFIGKEIKIGDMIIYTPRGKHTSLEYGIVIALDFPNGTTIKLIRCEKQTWKWCTKTRTNIATGEYVNKKVTISSPDNTLIVNPELLNEGDKEWILPFLELYSNIRRKINNNEKLV